MDPIAQTFLSEIDAYLKASGTDATTFGKQVLADPSFVFDLRKGRSPSTRTMEKVRAAMSKAKSETPAAAPKVLTPKAMTHLDKLEAESLNDTNRMELRVFGDDSVGHALLVAKLDNLGKGASGAAVQSLRMMFSLPPLTA